tara:strand:+ start:4110 stop:4553 length:444 start_codon:yes stop_codon:yes gene_type:complete
MIKFLKFFIILKILFLNFNYANSNDDIFEEALKKYNKKDFEQSKFLFQRSIVFNPKDARSYLYLAKIFNNEENQSEEKKNLDTTLLLEPNNEEALYMLINIELERSNFEKVNLLLNNFEKSCNKLCNKKNEINKSLQDFQSKNEKTE